MSERLVPFLSAEKIRELVRDLARRIAGDYGPVVKQEGLLVVVTLKGAMFFAADLMRELNIPSEVDFVRVASYGRGKKSSGEVRILKDVETPIENRHVLVLDEIVDSGRTVKFLVERLQAGHPKSLKICGLLSKPSRREVEVKVDYLGLEVQDKFLVGYGLDFAEKYRNLPEICVLEQE